MTAAQAPHLALTKTSTESSFSIAGTVLHYTITATNDGNVTLSGVSISDPLLGALTCTPSQPASLAPGASLACTGTYTVTQADLDAGHRANTATGGGTGPGGQPVSATANRDVPAAQVRSLGLVKTAAETSFGAAGTTIHYTLVATNTGNVTLSAVSIADPLLGSLSCTPTQPTTLLPGATLSCTGVATTTQPHLDAGHIDNTATASGTAPGNIAVGATDDLSIPGIQAPHIVLAKSAAEPSFSSVGTVLHYTLVATNDGNSTLTAVTISDPLLGTLSCTPAQPATLAPGASLSCTGTYTVGQADLDAGHRANTASVAGTGPAAQPVSDTATEDVPAAQSPHVSLTKGATELSFSSAGTVLHYTLVATNDGNVTLTGVAIADPLLGTLSCTPSQPATLAPGAGPLLHRDVHREPGRPRRGRRRQHRSRWRARARPGSRCPTPPPRTCRPPRSPRSG